MNVFLEPYTWDRPGDGSQPVVVDIAKPHWTRVRFRLYECAMTIVGVESIKAGTQKRFDWRSKVWPPCGPYWLTNEGSNNSGGFVTLVAYTPNMDEFHKCWPHAQDIDIQSTDLPIEWTDRFYKPDWVV